MSSTTTSAPSATVQQLLDRVAVLERRVGTVSAAAAAPPPPQHAAGEVASAGAPPPPSAEALGTLTERLAAINRKYESSVAGARRGDKFQAVLKRVSQVEKYASPRYVPSGVDVESVGARAAVLCAAETEIRALCRDLATIDTLSPTVLGSEHLRAAAGLSSRLGRLERVQLAQWEACGEVTGRTARLLATYNGLVDAINGQLLAWWRTIAALTPDTTDTTATDT